VMRLKWKLDSVCLEIVQLFGTFGNSATLDARLVLGLRRMCRRLGNNIGGTRWNS
jgi:hypothetical protein